MNLIYLSFVTECLIPWQLLQFIAELELTDQNDTEWVYHPRLSWQMDVDNQVHWHDVLSVSWTKSGERGSIRTHCQLLWQHPIAPVS
jgi:hypothetical protein